MSQTQTTKPQLDRPRKVRVGAVSYLNTKPLVYRLGELAPQAEIIFDLPSRLADDLSAGKLDIALIPSIEYFHNPAYTIVSDACIGCRGPVLSVKLLSRKPISQIQTLALDEGSRTSIALVRILLKEKYGLTPQLRPLPIGAEPQHCDADAILLIGDRAMHPPCGDFVEAWDLGDQWLRWSESPFVFAMWTARTGVDLQGLDVALSQARDEGLAHLEQIASLEAEHVSLSPEDTLTYLRDNLYFYLGPREQRGLELFYQHASRLGLAPEGLDLKFYDCQAS